MNLDKFLKKHNIDPDKDRNLANKIADVWLSQWHRGGKRSRKDIWDYTEDWLLNHSGFMKSVSDSDEST